MFDRNTVWPMITGVMHYLSYIGVEIVVLVLFTGRKIICLVAFPPHTESESVVSV